MRMSKTLVILASIVASFTMLISIAAPAWAQPSPPPDPSTPWTPPEEEGEESLPPGVSLSPSTVVPPPPSGTSGAISSAYLRDNAGQAKNQFVGSDVFFLVMQVNMPGRFYLYEYYPPGNVPQGHWLIYRSWIANGGTWTIGPFYAEAMEPEGQHVWRLWFWGGGRWAEYLVRWNYYSQEEQKFPVISSFTASPGRIQNGDSATLSWSVNNATTVTIEPGLGSVPASGSRSISPAYTTSYTLTATNSTGSRTAQAAVTVEPVQGSGGNGNGNNNGGGTNWGPYLLVGLLVVVCGVIAVLLLRRRTAIQHVSSVEPYTPVRSTRSETPTSPITTDRSTVAYPATQTVVSAPPARLVLPNGDEIPVAGGTTTLGRGDFKAIVPLDKIIYVSKNHLTIGFESGHYYIEDQGSANGTRLNGKEIKGLGRQWLRDGDRINVANAVDFTFETR